MDHERRQTIFDGKDNDWMGFAKRQAEFYRNIDQYIMNLVIDLSDIDAATDELLREIEVSDCNVTYGYKMFRELKDLRMKRKQKAEELECLYILTERLDVTMIAEEYEVRLEKMNSYIHGDGSEVNCSEVNCSEVNCSEVNCNEVNRSEVNSSEDNLGEDVSENITMSEVY